MQTARDLVGVLVELTARMQLCHDDLSGGDAFFLVNFGRNAAPVITDCRRTIWVQHDLNLIRMTGQCLVNGIVHGFIDHMVQARAVIGVANVHARTLAHRVQTAQHLDR